MKKGIIAVVVILVLVVLGMPVVNGILMEKGFRKLVENANTMYVDAGSDTKLEIIRYDRGLLSTEVEWKIDLGSLKSVYSIDEIVFLDRAKHGYRGVVSQTSLEKNSWYTDFVDDTLGGQDPVSMSTAYMLSGDIEMLLSLHPVTLMVEGETITSKPGELFIGSDWDLETFTANGTWQGFAVADQLELADVAFSSNLKVVSTYIWEGNGSVEFAKMSATDQDVNLIMEKLKIEQSLKFDEVKNTLAVDVSYGVGSISDGMEKVEDGFVTLGLRGIDAVAYEEAMKIYTDLVSDILDEIGDVAGNEDKLIELLSEQMDIASLQMMTLAEKFLKGGLEIYMHNLHAKFAQGEVDGNVLVRLEKDITLGQMIPMLNSPEMIFEYLSFASDVQLPIALVGDDPMLTSPIYPGMKTGVFVVDGPNLMHKAETKDKKLYINGEELQFN